MAVGANISYPNQQTLLNFFKKKLAEDREGKNPAGYISIPKFCMKVSATAPTNSNADDEPNAIGDICLQFNAAGTEVIGIYVATALTPTWVRMIPAE